MKEKKKKLTWARDASIWRVSSPVLVIGYVEVVVKSISKKIVSKQRKET